MNTQQTDKATARPFSPISTLCGDAHVMGLNQTLINEAHAEHAALVAVAEAAENVCNASSNAQRQSRIEALELVLANLAAVRKQS